MADIKMSTDKPLMSSRIPALTVVDEYRRRAHHSDVFALSGREGYQATAEFIAKNILSKIHIRPGSTVVDVGCGEGTFLLKANESVPDARYIGILPTEDEVTRAQIHVGESGVEIKLGRAEATGLPAASADVVVLNGVLLLVPRPKMALAEMARIAKRGATVFVGEMPTRDELGGDNASAGLIRGLASTLRHGGGNALVSTVRHILRSWISGWGSDYARRKLFWMAPDDFQELALKFGFVQEERFVHMHLTGSMHTMGAGHVIESPTSRMNYLFTRY